MRLFSTRIHGLLDYLVGALLIGAPWLLGFARGGSETWIPVAIGVAILVYSALTQYEFGVARRLDIPVHLWLDGVGGVVLAASPWLFGFEEHVWVPHLVVGLVLVALAVLTDTIPGFDRRSPDRA